MKNDSAMSTPGDNVQREGPAGAAPANVEWLGDPMPEDDVPVPNDAVDVVSASPDVQPGRPILGFAPWLYPPAAKPRWDHLRPLLEYLNFPAYHFHTTNAVYRREIDASSSPLDGDGLAGRLDRGRWTESGETEFAGLMRAMHFAKDAGASLHMITARPGHPFPTTGAFATRFGDYMSPFSIRGYISYMAEFLRYARQDEQLPIHIVNLIDEPRWFFLHAATPPDPENGSGAYYGLITPEELWSLYPATWDFAYTFLHEQLMRRSARDGINIQMLSDVYPQGKHGNDVLHLLTSTAVTSAANGLCFVNYSGPDGADLIIRNALADMVSPGAADRRVFFKDMGGRRVRNATTEQELAFGLDSIAGAMRAFRQGVDFCAQYFFLSPESGVDSDPAPLGLFAVRWNGTDYAARRPLVPLALFNKTQTAGAYRLKDRVAARVPEVDYLGLLSNRGKPDEYCTYYFVNRSTGARAVDFTPVRKRQLYRYWLNFGHDTGRTIRAQTLAPAAALRVPLPARSMTALTEQKVGNLNWPIRD